MQSIFDAGGEIIGRERDEELCTTGQRWKRDWSLHRKTARQAALKAANRGHTDIRLRERGTKKIHVFTGERKQVKKPKGAPAWKPAKIWKPLVKKVGVEKLEEATAKVVVVKRTKK